MGLGRPPVCSETPATSPNVSVKSLSGSLAGKVCSVMTLRPACAPTAMRTTWVRAAAHSQAFRIFAARITYNHLTPKTDTGTR